MNTHIRPFQRFFPRFSVKEFFRDETQLKKISSLFADASLRPSLFTLLTNLCTESSIRQSLLEQNDFAKILTDDFVSTHDDDQQANLLGLLINLTSSEMKVEVRLIEAILRQLKTSTNQQRLFTLLGNIVQNDASTIDVLLDQQIVRSIGEIVVKQNDEVLRAALRLLALLTQTNGRAQELVANEFQRKEIKFSLHRIFVLFSFDFYLRKIHFDRQFAADRKRRADLLQRHSPAFGSHDVGKTVGRRRNASANAEVSRRAVAERCGEEKSRHFHHEISQSRCKVSRGVSSSARSGNSPLGDEKRRIVNERKPGFFYFAEKKKTTRNFVLLIFLLFLLLRLADRPAVDEIGQMFDVLLQIVVALVRQLVNEFLIKGFSRFVETNLENLRLNILIDFRCRIIAVLQPIVENFVRTTQNEDRVNVVALRNDAGAVIIDDQTGRSRGLFEIFAIEKILQRVVVQHVTLVGVVVFEKKFLSFGQVVDVDVSQRRVLLTQFLAKPRFSNT